MSDYSFLAIADVHIGCKLYNIPELGEDLKDNLTRLFDLAIKLKVSYVFIAGDLFDSNRPSPDLIAFVRQQVKRLRTNGIITAGISGDHEKLVNGSAWIYLCGILPVSSVDSRFVGYDYNDDSMTNIRKLDELDNKDEIEWIFLHGHVPELFGFVEDKKKLDFKEINLIEEFTSLKGVILGDIHQPTEGIIHDPKMVREDLPFIGYCGSLGMVKSNEIGSKKGVLYYDGNTLRRYPFELDRKFIKLDLKESLTPINWITKYSNFFKDWKEKKPVIVVEYDKESKDQLPQISPLYEVAIVKTSLVRRGGSDEAEEKEESVNIRSELATTDRLEKVLKSETALDKATFDLAYSLLTSEDPASILDKFKEETL
jgi:DNA repair exonuclease SbcCD nuclease subunit